MNSEAPDPKTFKSWEDAFNYPVPAVRRMELQLRNDISSNREKLRTLVGASYRDLLGTAESIIEMDSQMHLVETRLGDISRKCNTRLLDTSASNMRLLHSRRGLSDRERYAIASQLAILRSCPEALSRLVRRGGSLLLAAKVLVIGRLLHKKLSSHARTAPYVESIRTRLARQRLSLLETVDRRLKSMSLDVNGLVDAMCAYSLATSSSTADVLRHFHHVRLDAISADFRSASTSDSDVLRALHLWIQTIKDTESVFPRQVTAGLAKIKATFLFKSADIRDIIEFDYDIHESWLGEDVKNFTPYIRHDDLNVAATLRELNDWAPAALTALLTGIGHCLGSVDDPKRTANLRKTCLEAWFSGRVSFNGLDKPDVFDGLRRVFLDRLKELARLRSASLADIAHYVRAVSKEPSRLDHKIPSLWTCSVSTTETANGAKGLIQNLQSRQYGKSKASNHIVEQYRNWLASVNLAQETIRDLRGTKWERDLDDLDEDEDSSNKVQTILAIDDPKELEDELVESLTKAFTALEASMAMAIEDVASSPDPQYGAAFTLRITREIQQALPNLYKGDFFASSNSQSLHKMISSPLVEELIQKCTADLSRFFRSTALPERILWDGDPELPILPSPWVFKILRSLELALSDAGSDIWSPKAVDEMKKNFREALSRELTSLGHSYTSVNGSIDTAAAAALDGGDENTTNGTNEEAALDEKPQSFPSEKRDAMIQHLFNLLYLDCATSDSGSDDDFSYYRVQVEAQLDLELGNIARLKKGAATHWQRTELLFGLLSPAQPAR